MKIHKPSTCSNIFNYVFQVTDALTNPDSENALNPIRHTTHTNPIQSWDMPLYRIGIVYKSLVCFPPPVPYLLSFFCHCCFVCSASYGVLTSVFSLVVSSLDCILFCRFICLLNICIGLRWNIGSTVCALYGVAMMGYWWSYFAGNHFLCNWEGITITDCVRIIEEYDWYTTNREMGKSHAPPLDLDLPPTRKTPGKPLHYRERKVPNQEPNPERTRSIDPWLQVLRLPKFSIQSRRRRRLIIRRWTRRPSLDPRETWEASHSA